MPEPAMFLNDQLVSKATLLTLDPKIINSMEVVKTEKKIENVWFNGEIHITTKGGYTPKLVSLTSLKAKYTNPGTTKTMFMIDGTFINSDFDKCLVDENYLLKIVVDHIKNAKESIDLTVVKLVTKPPENLKRMNEKRILEVEGKDGK